MPLPTLLSLTLASGMAAALAGRAELRVSPRPGLLSQSFFAWLAFAVLVLVPVSVYFYAFHGDWFLLYVFDVKRVPSALAMVGFALEVGLGALGFAFGSVLVRAQRETVALGLTVLLVLLAGAVVPAAGDRLGVVGTHAQFRGGFGLVPFVDGPLFTGALAMGGFFVLGAIVLLGRLWAGSRKG